MPTRIAARYMFVSGAAALIYEVLWIRDLSYVFGGSAQALSAVVAAFLAGLALGAWIAGARSRMQPGLLRAYAALELAIAATAPLVPWLVGLLDRALLDPLWPGIAGQDSYGAQFAARFLAAFVVMLPATACMGATLPVLCSAFVSPREESGVVIGRLYGWNTLGGVAGCLLAGFVFVEHVGLWKSRLVAAALNVALAVCALRLHARGRAQVAPGTAAGRAPAVAAAGPERGLSVPVWALALLVSSGVSIVLELCWSRLVALGVGGTTYSFSIVLAVYLLGLGGGALLYEAAARRRARTVRLLALTQLALALLLLALRGGVEPLFVRVGLKLYDASTAPDASPLLTRAGLGLLVSACVALVPSLLLGIAFPALSDLRVRRREEIGRGIGAAYLLSTAGGVAGSLATTFWLLPARGIETAIADAGLLAGLLGALLLVADPTRTRASWVGAGCAAAAALALFGFVRTHGRWEATSIYGGVGLYGRRALLPDRKLLSARDGPACSVAVFDQRGERSLAVNGKVDATSRGDVGTQLMLAWLPQLFHEEARQVFVLGWGAGGTAGAARRYGARVVCAEIEPAVVEVAELFAKTNGGAHRDPDVEIVLDDGRSLLRRGRRRFDVITTEPSNPWLAGMASLFTVEFYELCRARLSAGGVLCQWVQLYWSSPQDYQAIFATLGSVFPHVAIWRTTSNDTLMLASERPLLFDPATIERRAQSRPWLAGALAASSFRSDAPQSLAAQLARMVLLEGDDARAFADGGGRRIRDDVPFLEFSAARRMQANSAPAILATLLARRKSPLYAFDALAARMAPAEFAPLLRDVAADELQNGGAELAEPLLLEVRRRAPALDQLPFWLWLSSRRRGRAEESAQRLAELEQRTPELLLQVAEEQLRSSEFETAWALLDRLEQRFGPTATVEWQRGRARELQGRRSDAALHYERAAKIDPGFTEAREALRRLRESR